MRVILCKEPWDMFCRAQRLFLTCLKVGIIYPLYIFIALIIIYIYNYEVLYKPVIRTWNKIGTHVISGLLLHYLPCCRTTVTSCSQKRSSLFLNSKTLFLTFSEEPSDFKIGNPSALGGVNALSKFCKRRKNLS